MSGYSTKKEDDGSHSVVDSFGFRTQYTGLSEADAAYEADRLNRQENRGNDNTIPTKDTRSAVDREVPERSTPSNLSGRNTELGLFGKIITFIGCAVALIVAIFVVAGIIGWAIATFAVK